MPCPGFCVAAAKCCGRWRGRGGGSGQELAEGGEAGEEGLEGLCAGLAERQGWACFIRPEQTIGAQVLPGLSKGGEQVGEAEAVCLSTLQEVIKDAGLLLELLQALRFVCGCHCGAEVFEEGESRFVIFGQAAVEELARDGQGAFAAK